MLQFRIHMANWKAFELDQFNPAIKKPERFFVFYTIAGDHRREACTRLFDQGYSEYDIPARQPIFATNLSNCMFYLRPQQAKEIGRLDNSDKVARAPDAIDMIFLAKTHIEKLTVGFVVENEARFPVPAAILKSLKLEDVRKIPGCQNAYADEKVDCPNLVSIGDIPLYDSETGELFQPLRKTMNYIDIREMIYDCVMNDEKHPLLVDIHLNPRTKRSWRYAILMAMHGSRVTGTIKEVDEMLKNGSIGFTTIECANK
jgi:hypothetical protein